MSSGLRWGFGRRILIAAIGVMLLGCDLQGPYNDLNLKEADLVGVWVNQDTQDSLEFRPDKRFLSDRLPGRMFDDLQSLPEYLGKSEARVPGSGDWSIQAALANRDGSKNEVDLVIRVLDGKDVGIGVTLEAWREKSEIVLIYYLGASDSANKFSYIYHKCPENCLKVPPKVTAP
jgi:hypothetical protein